MNKDLFSCDLRSLGIFRIGLSLIILVDLICRATDLAAHYTDLGVLPRQVHFSQFSDIWHWSFHLAGGSARFQAFLFLLAGVFALMLLLGWRTRLATVLSWILLVSLHNRNTKILEGSDALLRMLLFWGMFLPLGARYSLDQRLGRVPQMSERVFSMGTAALLGQVFLLYFFTWLHKSGPEWRADYSALYYALHVDRWVTPFGLFLLRYQELLKGVTFFVIWFELLGAFLLFSPFWNGPVRTLAASIFCLMQIGFSLCLSLGIFPWVGIVAMIPFFRFSKPVTLQRIGPNFLPAFFFVYIFFWLLGALPNVPRLIPGHFVWIGKTFRLEQRWRLFAPHPAKTDGWYVIPGRLEDERKVDLFRQGRPVSWKRPKLISATFKNNRWRRYMRNLRKSKKHRPLYADYLCRDWNRRHGVPPRLVKLDLYFMKDKTLLNYRSTKPKKTRLLSYRCL